MTATKAPKSKQRMLCSHLFPTWYRTPELELYASPVAPDSATSLNHTTGSSNCSCSADTPVAAKENDAAAATAQTQARLHKGRGTHADSEREELLPKGLMAGVWELGICARGPSCPARARQGWVDANQFPVRQNLLQYRRVTLPGLELTGKFGQSSCARRLLYKCMAHQYSSRAIASRGLSCEDVISPRVLN